MRACEHMHRVGRGGGGVRSAAREALARKTHVCVSVSVGVRTCICARVRTQGVPR